jgi:hypothetical protein
LFTVSASGPADLSYRWHKDEVELTDGPTASGAVISGAMSPTLQVLGGGTADAGRYNMVVSNLCGITPSSAATLRLNLGRVTVTSVASGKVNLFWFGAPNVHLQSATNLTAAIAWTDLPDTAGQSSAAVPWAGPQMFFRLTSP